MLRFGPHVSCRLFRAEIALVLHHASVWSEIVGDVVTVSALGELEPYEPAHTPVDLTVELAIGVLEDDDTTRLAGYLSRVLAAAYGITVDPPIVRVEWDPRRTPGGNGDGERSARRPAA